ncbi:glutamate ABC transporter substrate-binding protein [Streptomyces carpaticus]|uniref:glutamate ABC transporter substrate-binding protein n=1 Tax=Streptomyces carpaticus TaxID=285558 RepID=UPI00220D6A4E|nr:glutamate ABC transporter substrate-binding protein [Streptomyces carpaticus]
MTERARTDAAGAANATGAERADATAAGPAGTAGADTTAAGPVDATGPAASTASAVPAAAAAPAAATPARTWTRTQRRRPGGGRPLLTAACGLALAGWMLAGSLPSPGDTAGAGHAHGEPPPVAGGRVVQVDDTTDDDDAIGSLAARETCANGTDPAAYSWSPSRDGGEAVRRITERGRLIVGVDQNSYLWGYRAPDDPQTVIGFDIDLARAVAADLLGDPGRVTLRPIPTDQRIPLLENREVDMVIRSMSITCDRWEAVAFSAPYFDTGQQLLAPRWSGITGFDSSLAGMRVCSGDDTTARVLLEREPHGAELVTAGGHLDCLVRIQLGEADALMTDGALAAAHAAQDPTMRLIGEPIKEESYGIAMNLDDQDLVRRVNAILEDYRSGGDGSAWQLAYRTWLADWFPPDISPEPAAPRYRD